jgi:signal transduction histidine kinase
MQKLSAEGEATFEVTHFRKDGTTVPLELYVRVTKWENRNIVFSIGTDISDRKRAEAEREKLEAQLRQAKKMEGLGQLAGGIAHDFNNLLQVILGYTDIMTMDLGPDRPKGLDAVRQAADRAADLTRQLLAFSRRQIIKPVNLDLNDLVQGVLKMIGRVIGEHIDLCFMPGERLGTVYADKGQIEQILMNLCVNARDAMPTGGTLTIETKNVAIGGEYCREHPWATEGRYVSLSVTDTGHGMDEATRAQIFDPFFTTKGVGQGTGLGLATVYGIVKQHNGLIDVYSEPGKGAAFKVHFPIVDRPAQNMEPKVEEPVVGGTETILVAEDEAMVRELVSRILQTAGYAVLTACDGEEALRVFEEHADAIDMAILDVMMPKLGGRDVMDRIQAKHPGMRFLFSSGYSETAIHTNFVIEEGLRLVTKPYRGAELLLTVREMLDAPPTP